MESSQFESLYPKETRQKEISKLLEIIASGRACQVVALPGVGKSTLLRLITYNKALRLMHLKDQQEKIHFVYMDFSEMRQRSLIEVLKFILISLSYSFGERGFRIEQNEINKILKDVSEYNDEILLFQALKRSIDYLTSEKDKNVIFLFDRFDEFIPFLDFRFFADLKILRNRAKYKFSCVFAVARPLESVLEPQIFSDFYEFLVGNVVYLPIFDEAGVPFRLSYLEKITGKKTRDSLKKELLFLSGGHGKLTRVAYEALLTSEKISSLKEFLLSKNEVRGTLFEVWRALTPQEQRALLEKRHDEYLEKAGLLVNNEITIPLLSDFVKSLPKKAAQIKIIYKSESNDIFKDDENITEKLSPSEFKLLRFLIENSGRVCEKDEIINAVWKDEKNKLGVTDQALDQTVYRLRKKIEEDPNNPAVLQTIKGRGYKLVEG